MPDHAPVTNSPNGILARLLPVDFDLLRAHLEPVELPVRMQLETAGKRVEHVYFIERGIASVVANGGSERGIEVGLIGREGMTGLPIVLGDNQATNATFIQLAGAGQRLPAERLAQAIAKSATLLRPMLRYVQVFGIQVATTALANGRSKLEERLARWLLMSHDRAEGDDLKMTHEFLSLMLGVRRPGVTTAITLLERSGLIRAHRSVITILDRDGLKELTNGAYGAAEAEQRRLLG